MSLWRICLAENEFSEEHFLLNGNVTFLNSWCVVLKFQFPPWFVLKSKVRRYLILILCFLPLTPSIDFQNVTKFSNAERLILKGLSGDVAATSALMRSSATEEAAYWHAVVHENVVFPVVNSYVQFLQSKGAEQPSYWIMLKWINQSTTHGRTVKTSELQKIAATFHRSPKILHQWLTIYPDSFDGRLWKAYFHEIAPLTEITTTAWLPLHYKHKLLHEISYLTVPPKNLNSSTCSVVVLPIVQSWKGLDKLRKFYTLLGQRSLKNDTGLCFHQAAVEPLDRLCQQTVGTHIKCQLSQFESLRRPSKEFSQLLIITDEGRANTHLGISYVNAKEPVKTVLHEFLHLFNFVDEYALPRLEQRRYCRTNRLEILGSNVVSIHRDLDIENIQQLIREIKAKGYRVGRWEMFLFHLKPVHTCQDEPVATFRISDSAQSSATLMQYADASMPVLYWHKMKEEIQRRLGMINHFAQAMNDGGESNYIDWQSVAMEYNGASNYFAADILAANGKSEVAHKLLLKASRQGYSLASMLLAIELLKTSDTTNQHEALELIEQAALSGEYVALELYVSLLKKEGRHDQAKLWQALINATQ